MIFRVKQIKSSEVVSAYIRQRKYPAWTSFYMKQKDVVNDQFGYSHFNWGVDEINYHVLRTGCYPLIKYHCTKAPFADLTKENIFYGLLKLANFGIPCFLYGLCGVFLAKHKDTVQLRGSNIELKFWYEETW